MHKLPALPKQLSVHLASLSASTADQYRRRLDRFYQHTGQRLSSITRRSVQDYLVYLARDRHISASYQNTCLSALRWAVRVTGQRTDLTGLTARRSERLPAIISHRDATALLRHMDGQPHDVVSLVYGAGLTLTEALSLTLNSLDRDRVVVCGRSVVPPESITIRLYAYATLAGSDGRLFDVNTNSVSTALKRAVKAAGLTQIVGTRELRNSFAARQFEAGYTIMEIKEVMGYKRLDTLLKIKDQVR